MPIYLRHGDFLRRLPDFSLGVLGMWAKLILGFRRKCRFVNIHRMASRLRVPVLFIHGKRDSYVPVATVESLRSKVRSSTRLWVVPKAKHNGAIRLAPKPYSSKAISFFDRHLHPTPRPLPALPFLVRPPEETVAVEPS